MAANETTCEIELEENAEIDESFAKYVDMEDGEIDINDIDWDDFDFGEDLSVPGVVFVSDETTEVIQDCVVAAAVDNFRCSKCNKSYKRKKSYEKHVKICGG